MLCREVCKHCLDQFVPPDGDQDSWGWDEDTDGIDWDLLGEVPCPATFFNEPISMEHHIISIQQLPPKYCFYQFEHAVAAGRTEDVE